MDATRIDQLLGEAVASPGGITVLTGAGISAESGIPTFRGPEGYWTVGSRIYQPQEMATVEMFRQNPKAVWQWYLYRLGVCRQAQPNPGHTALVEMEKLFLDRFCLITQNVDNLHLRAGQSIQRTYQIHGNIAYVRCSAECRQTVDPMPVQIETPEREALISDRQWRLLHCPACGNLLRPHVLWFDETYNEPYYKLESALNAARRTSLLIVVGTSGATNLPNQIVRQVYHQGGAIMDINIDKNHFGRLAENYRRGVVIRQPSSRALPWLAERLKAIRGAQDQ